jgi:16S rRNA (adenine1518-N6/adenine1519-N6)-dimethyltransferase
MKLSEMRDLLAGRGIQLTKSLGQNFLHDSNQLDRIIALADIQSGDQVLEIGPGLGPLTEHLLGAGAKVFAIEKDRRLFELLEEFFSGKPNLQLLLGDALYYLKKQPRDWTGWKLVANLPYSVASPILVELASRPEPPSRLIATLQLEVLQRILARAGEEHYGQLSLFLQLRYEPKEWFKIPPGSFFPPPDIDSGCLRLDLRPEGLLSPEQIPDFFRIVKRAFSERRKIMLKLLKHDWPAAPLESAYKELSIPLQARAETVSLESFVRITRRLTRR